MRGEREVVVPGGSGVRMFNHDAESWGWLWGEVGAKTGTASRAWEDVGVDEGDVRWMEEGWAPPDFVVTRVA